MDIVEFCKTDIMLKEIYEDYIIKCLQLDYLTVVSLLNFFCTFSIGYRSASLNDLADLYSQRTNAFYYILIKSGYNYGNRKSRNKDYGIGSILTKSFYKVLDEQ